MSEHTSHDAPCLACFEESLMPTAYDGLIQAIGFPKSTRKMVAVAYRRAMVSGEAIDWPAINRRIINCWSKSGLVYIKTQAWQMLTLDERNYMEGR